MAACRLQRGLRSRVDTLLLCFMSTVNSQSHILANDFSIVFRTGLNPTDIPEIFLYECKLGNKAVSDREVER